MLALFNFTIRQMLTQRKLWLTVAMLLFPAAVAVVVRSVGGAANALHAWQMYNILMQFVLIVPLMPLVTVLYGTALIGGEVEQRTLVYLTTRRLHRATVLLVRFAATWLVLSALFALAMLALHLAVTFRATVGTVPSLGPWQPWQDVREYLLIAPAGAAGFLAMFTAISFVFSRALMASVLYVVLFELTLGNLPVLARRLCIGHLLRETMVQKIPGVSRLYELRPEIADLVYPPGQTGTWTLLIVVAALLVMASVLMSVRELVPARVSRD
jgi:ABC-2 type transport system permease protein